MANQNHKEGTQEIFCPYRGLNETAAYSHQAELTSPLLCNVRVRGVSENRARGGQRPGMSKVFATQAGSDRPVIRIVQITNTYIKSS